MFGKKKELKGVDSTEDPNTICCAIAWGATSVKAVARVVVNASINFFIDKP